MVYQRRYFPGAYVTTPMLGEVTVTTGKIADKAVTTPKLADDSVISEKILDETIKSEDIKDGEIKTPDIKDGAVTSSKIAAGAVTPEKLSEALAGIVRPLTPPAGTNEIDDEAITTPKIAGEAVTMAKIGPYAVQESRIAPSAVTRAKIADLAINSDKIEAAAIDVTKLKTGSVDGPKIVDGVVSASKLSPNAVTTTKIAPRAVTSDRIAVGGVIEENILDNEVTKDKLHPDDALRREHYDGLIKRYGILHEEFGGVDISNRWVNSGDAGGLIENRDPLGLLISTGLVDGNEQKLHFGGKPITLPVDDLPYMEFMITDRFEVLGFQTLFNGLWKDDNNYIGFFAESLDASTPNWIARCKDNGVLTSVDTGIPVSLDIQEFRILVRSYWQVEFYIWNDLVATISTNVPSDKNLEPLFRVVTRANHPKYFFLKYLEISGLRNRGVYP